MAGFLTYMAVFTLTILWVLGWAGVSFAFGAFFGLSMKTTVLVGAVLGPLGVVVVLVVGVLERSVHRSKNIGAGSEVTVLEWDRFS